MGHHISKQNSPQMTDDEQVIKSIGQHGRQSTTSKVLHIEGENRPITTNVKKLKKEQNQRCDFKSLKETPSNKSITNTLGNKERTGSVVITIRLMKMESAESFEVATTGSEEVANSSYSCNNYSSGAPQNKCESIKNTNYVPQCDVSWQDKNSNQNQNSIKVDNNNMVLHQSEVDVPIGGINGARENEAIHMNSFISNNGESKQCKKNMHVDCGLRSEVTICDKNSTNYSSQLEQSSKIPNIPNIENCMMQTFSTVAVSDATYPDVSLSQTINLKAKASNLISPYPHHIPIANITRSDCLNVDIERQNHIVKDDDNYGGNNNTESRDMKEKGRRQNWLNLTCGKLRGIKSLSSPSSKEPSTTSSNLDNSYSGTNNNINSHTGCSPEQQSPALQLENPTLFSTNDGNVIVVTMDQQQPFPYEYSNDDCDKKARLQRAIEIEEGVEPPPGFISSSLQSLNAMPSPNQQLIPDSISASVNDVNSKISVSNSHAPKWLVANVCSNTSALRLILQHAGDIPKIHSQVDYIHCLVPDLKQITNCSFYWGKMDRYEAERLLENKPEGTFLLRDSAQEEFLFSVSFRKYTRSLHARIEQFNHTFSFDCHDPMVFTSKTVTGLLEHYKDPACVMFFEPALTQPLNRNFVFSLQQLCRATIVSHSTYDGINDICLPRKLKLYLKEYHYKQRVRVRFDDSTQNTT